VLLTDHHQGVPARSEHPRSQTEKLRDSWGEFDRPGDVGNYESDARVRNMSRLGHEVARPETIVASSRWRSAGLANLAPPELPKGILDGPRPVGEKASYIPLKPTFEPRDPDEVGRRVRGGSCEEQFDGLGVEILGDPNRAPDSPSRDPCSGRRVFSEGSNERHRGTRFLAAPARATTFSDGTNPRVKSVIDASPPGERQGALQHGEFYADDVFIDLDQLSM
jgi:hypothetical protein